MKTLLLSAGFGKRLLPLTKTTPKPLIKINKKCLIDYNLDLLWKYGLTDVVVNVSYLAGKIIQYLGDSVIYSYEDQPVGTAGAIFKLRNWLDEDFLVVNSDTIHQVNLDRMVKNHLDSNAIVTVFTKDNETHNGGIFVFSSRVFNFLPYGMNSIHEDLIPILSKIGRVNLYGKDNEDEFYFDIGTLEKLKKAEAYYENH